MKRFLKFNFLVAMTLIATVGCCEKDNLDKATLSPPSWIQGEWEWDHISDVIYFKFPSNDITITTATLQSSDNTLIFSDAIKKGIASIKETINTNTIYEVALTTQSENYTYNFRKGDGTYIDFALNSDVYTKLPKK